MLRNDQLRTRSLPDPEGDLDNWDAFTHTIDGYQAAGSFEACATLTNDRPARTLMELRSALCFGSRRMRPAG